MYLRKMCLAAKGILCQVEALPLKVSGAIPTWLHGDYIRNGPGTFKGMDHLFDGYGMLVKFSFENGKVTTQQRYATLASPNMPDCSACQAQVVNCHPFCMPCLQRRAWSSSSRWLAHALMATKTVSSLELWQAVFARSAVLIFPEEARRPISMS